MGMQSMFAAKLTDAVSHSIPLAEQLFDDLRGKTADGAGVTRDSYGKGEQVAHDLIERAALSLDLEINKDPAGNLYMTQPGADQRLPAWFLGHLVEEAWRDRHDVGRDIVYAAAKFYTDVEMRVSPSGSAFRSRSQTTPRCCGKEPWL